MYMKRLSNASRKKVQRTYRRRRCTKSIRGGTKRHRMAQSKVLSKPTSNVGSSVSKPTSNVGSLPLVVGKIFSNSCYHCIAMEGEWSKLTTNLDPNMFHDIEASEISVKLPALNQKYRVQVQADGFPTIYKIVRCVDGSCRVEYYEGPRDAQSMHQWIVRS